MTAPGPNRQKLDGVVVHRASCSQEKTTAINKLILGVIVKGQRPISIVEDEAFMDLLAYLEPGYQCPSRTFFTAQIDKKYDEATMKLSTFLASQLTRGLV